MFDRRRMQTTAGLALSAIVGLIAFWWIRRTTLDRPVELLPSGGSTFAPSHLPLERMSIGPKPRYGPWTTNLQIADLDRDGLLDVVECDARYNRVRWNRQTQEHTWESSDLADDLIAPAHATVVDLDQDGDLDILVSILGNIFPDDDHVGSVVLLENKDNKFHKHTLLGDVRRVADVQAGDLDADGDLDLVVAVFGYAHGEILWLENLGGGAFRDRQIFVAPGTIHVPLADFDGDGDLDIAAVVSQDEEEVWTFENHGSGKFLPRRVFSSINFDLGSAGLICDDLDRDGDPDLILPVGDNLEDVYSYPQPYHGCFWLENQGSWQFTSKRVANFGGTYAAATGDLDGDHDRDIVLVSMVNDWDHPGNASLIWLENDGQQSFRPWQIDDRPTHLVTVACADVNRDGRDDIVAAGLFLTPPFDRQGGTQLWMSVPSDPQRSANGWNQEIAPRAPASAGPNLSRLPAMTSRDLKALEDKVSVDPNLQRELGEAYLAHGYFIQAEATLRKVTAVDPNDFAAEFGRAYALDRLGRTGEANKSFESAARLADPESFRKCIFQIARNQMRQEDLAAAIHEFSTLDMFAPADYQRARLLVSSGRITEALPLIDRLLAANSNELNVLLLAMQAARAQGDERTARAYAARAERATAIIRQNEHWAYLHPIRTRFGMHATLDQVERAISSKEFVQASEHFAAIVSATDPEFLLDKLTIGAELALLANRPQEALRLLNVLAEHVSMPPKAWHIKGDAYAKLGDIPQAKAAWEHGQTLHPRAETHFHFSTLYEQQGNLAAARIEKGRGQVLAGMRAYRLNRLSAAHELLVEAVSNVSEEPKAWFYLGEVLQAMEKPKDSPNSTGATRLVELPDDAYRRCVELNPTFGRALERLGK